MCVWWGSDCNVRWFLSFDNVPAYFSKVAPKLQFHRSKTDLQASVVICILWSAVHSFAISHSLQTFLTLLLSFLGFLVPCLQWHAVCLSGVKSRLLPCKAIVTLTNTEFQNDRIWRCIKVRFSEMMRPGAGPQFLQQKSFVQRSPL